MTDIHIDEAKVAELVDGGLNDIRFEYLRGLGMVKADNPSGINVLATAERALETIEPSDDKVFRLTGDWENEYDGLLTDFRPNSIPPEDSLRSYFEKEGFEGLEVSPVRDETPDEDETNYITCAMEDAEFWSIYGVRPDGESRILHDSDNISDMTLRLVQIAFETCVERTQLRDEARGWIRADCAADLPARIDEALIAIPAGGTGDSPIEQIASGIREAYGGEHAMQP